MNGKDRPLVIIVDDNIYNIQVVGNILAEKGYETAVFINGAQAFEFLQLEKPDLILLDIMMPGINGYDMCRKLKEDISTKDIPVIFLSAKIETQDLVKGFDVGAADFVTKPFKSEELLARINTHVELYQARKRIKILQGLISICAECKKIRDKNGCWNEMEVYIEKHSNAQFSHGLCPTCESRMYSGEDWYRKQR